MMTGRDNRYNCVNGTGTLYSEGVAHGRASVGCKPSQTIIKRLHQTDNDFVDFRLCSLNVGTLRGRSGEIVEMLERRSIDMCCVQEVRWRGKSCRMIAGKATKYKLFWIGSDSGFGGVGILLAEKWIDKVIDVNRVNDRIILIKIMVQESILSVISVYAPQCGLDDVQKDRFYDSLINIAGRLEKKLPR